MFSRSLCLSVRDLFHCSTNPSVPQNFTNSAPSSHPPLNFLLFTQNALCTPSLNFTPTKNLHNAFRSRHCCPCRCRLSTSSVARTSLVRRYAVARFMNCGIDVLDQLALVNVSRPLTLAAALILTTPVSARTRPSSAVPMLASRRPAQALTSRPLSPLLSHSALPSYVLSILSHHPQFSHSLSLGRDGE